jgi:hypothetical protein
VKLPSDYQKALTFFGRVFLLCQALEMQCCDEVIGHGSRPILEPRCAKVLPRPEMKRRPRLSGSLGWQGSSAEAAPGTKGWHTYNRVRGIMEVFRASLGFKTTLTDRAGY